MVRREIFAGGFGSVAQNSLLEAGCRVVVQASTKMFFSENRKILMDECLTSEPRTIGYPDFSEKRSSGRQTRSTSVGENLMDTNRTNCGTLCNLGRVLAALC